MSSKQDGMRTVLFEDYLLSSTSLLTKATLPYSLPGSKASWVSLHPTSLPAFHSSYVFPASLQQPLPCVLAYCFAASPFPSLRSGGVFNIICSHHFPAPNHLWLLRVCRVRAKVLSFSFKVFHDLALLYLFRFTSFLLPTHKLFIPHR